MKIIPVKVDDKQMESMPFGDISFPVDSWDDVFDSFIDETLNCHWHPEFEFGVLMSGSLDYNVGGIHMKMNEGDAIFINSNTMHTAKKAKGGHGAVIKGVGFPASLFADSPSSTIYKKHFEPVITSNMQGFIIPQDSEHSGEFVSNILKVNTLNRSEFAYELKCMSIISKLWESTISYINSNDPELLKSKGNRKYEMRAKEILSYIHENFSESITVDRLSKHANISRTECFRSFKQFTNKKPVEYINEYRLYRAAKMLMESGLSITEIALKCGYNNSAYFGKQFKKAYGVSPGNYRQPSLRGAKRRGNPDAAL